MQLNDCLPETMRVLLNVGLERIQQDFKWGRHQSHNFEEWLVILMEEIGESARAQMELKYRPDEMDVLEGGRNFREELVQVAAVAVAMIEAGDRDGWFDAQR